MADFLCSTGKQKAECTVTQPMLYAAIPVGAVSSTGLWLCWVLMSISLIVMMRKLFPTPAPPVTNSSN